MNSFLPIALCLLSAAPAACGNDLPSRLDLSGAVIVTAPNLASSEQKAVTVLVEEIEKRTGFRLQPAEKWPDAPKPVIVLGVVHELVERVRVPPGGGRGVQPEHARYRTAR